MATRIECPVDFVTVNDNKIRLTAFSVLLVTLGYLLVPHWGFFAFLCIDFFLRAFNFGKYSLLHIISDRLTRIFSIPVKPIDQAPKRFAAKIGFAFSVAILLLTLTQYNTAALVLAGIIALFAFLESVLGFCAGCYAYTFYKKLWPAKNAAHL